MSMRSGSATTVLGLALVVLGAIGCAVTQPSADPWVITYDGSPDDVWTAIHIVLVDLDYDVQSENREDGVVKANRSGDAENPAVILSLDQIMRSGEVKVYVRVAAAAGEPALTFEQKEKTAKDFLALVHGLLFK